ncbi:MAG: hypothetical protein R6W78_10115 [Bacteroidales bacterium]
MECKLCRQEKKLIKAHIIPSFMYHELFDQNHRIRQATFENKVYKRNTQRETGEFDKNILCEKCDNEILGKYEDYAKRVLYDGATPNLLPRFERMYNKTWMSVGDIDYKKFKIFLLSIIWRASITSRPYFSQINLGHHEEIIRKMILNNDPKKKEDYPILITYTGLYTTQVIARPKLVRMGKKVYSFLIAGVIYNFFIECDDIPDYLYETTINEKNEMKILLTDKSYAAELTNANLFE